MDILSTLVFITRHPLNRKAKISALVRWLKWQLGSRLLPGGAMVPYVEDAKLLVAPGMTGATGNIYCGLHEFEDMALVLHALRPDDLFVDIGANVGSYTVLAGRAAGACCISVEPIPATFEWLRRNISINDLEAKARLLNIGLGREAGTLRFTGGLDTMNHVIDAGDNMADVLEVPVRTLDDVLDGTTPTLIKIDVEGFETEVIKGGERTLGDHGLVAVVMELNGSGSRYGFDEEALHREMIEYGFTACRYLPFERRLEPLSSHGSGSGNTLYVRDIEGLSGRVRSAPRFRLGIGGEI